MYELYKKKVFKKKSDLLTDRQIDLLTYLLTGLLTDKVIHRGAPFIKKKCITMLNAQQNPTPTASCVGAKFFFAPKIFQRLIKIELSITFFELLPPKAHNWTLSKTRTIRPWERFKKLKILKMKKKRFYVV